MLKYLRITGNGTETAYQKGGRMILNEVERTTWPKTLKFEQEEGFYYNKINWSVFKEKKKEEGKFNHDINSILGIGSFKYEDDTCHFMVGSENA